jgi:Importin-beta N-terminal domain
MSLTLDSLLQACLSPVDADRKQAEAALDELKSNPDALLSLMSTMCLASEEHVRQMAAVLLKQRLKTAWAAVPAEQAAEACSSVQERSVSGRSRP